VNKNVKRTKVKQIIEQSIRDSLSEILDVPKINLEKLIYQNKPCLLLFLGFNGSGKTTSIAKIAYRLKKNGYSCVLAAADTFRAASIEQLGEHSKKLKVDMIKHKYGSDSAAVIYDAVEYAKSKKIDAVLADTAGRMHTNKNLMDELKKICRVNKPDLKILVIDSLSGNDVVEQAKLFDNDVGTDAVILTKVDVNKKGGAILSVCQLLKKPIVGLGMGQKYEDFEEFEKEKFVKNLLG